MAERSITLAQKSPSSPGHILKRLLAVFKRVLQQLRHDRLFLILSLAAPLMIVFFLKIFFDSLEGPGFTVSRFIVPIGAFIVHFLTYILCSISLVRERTSLTLSRMIVNGYRPTEIIFGYLLAYTVLATLQTLLVLMALGWFFNLDYQFGTQASIYLIIWLLAVISISLGILLSNLARNEGQMLPTIPMIIFPSVFLSGMLIQVDRLPEWAQWLSIITPVSYANNVLQKLIKPGGSLGDDWVSLVELMTFGLVVIVLASFTLKERD
ncbi:MAG: ABC transporter permease [Chloroflexota bacterium]|nr:ABC transporter permease [Chloroflexota bacterium]